ncbi:MAG: Polysaccharide biosynthesis protein [Tenericutes bacterium ADurb.BinA124]|nr:MAG: Polysaccharide biosynthesis protein [Tenericutes bacterium ADurb.BinA124]
MNKITKNEKIVVKNIAGAFIVKGLALVLSLFTTPAYIHYFNNNVRLGLWFTLLSILSWILSFDLGIGNGLRNKLTIVLSNQDDLKAKKLISSAYISIGVISIAAIVIFGVVVNFVNWNIVFNVDYGIATSEGLKITVFIVFSGIMLQFFFKLINSIIYSLQKSSINNFLSLITSVLIFVFVRFTHGGGSDDDLIVMGIVHSLAVIIPLIVASMFVFIKPLKKVRPSFSFFDKVSMKEILTLGGTFFIIQGLYMVIISTNDYLITLFVGSESVVDYQIYYRFFSLGSTAFMLALTPIWSIVTKAINEKDYDWTKKMYKRMLWLSVIATFCEFCIVFIIQWLINLFYGQDAIQVDYIIAISFALFGSLMIFNSSFSCITNGMGKLKCQAISFGIGAAIKIPISFLLVSILSSWVGVVIATCICLLIYCLLEPFYIRKILLKYSNEKNEQV